MSESTVVSQKPRSFEATEYASAYASLLKTRPGILASEAGGELDWLRRARERDFNRWSTEGLPNKRNEKWMYTNVAPIADAKVELPRELTSLPSRESLSSLKGVSGTDVVFVNGHFSRELSRLQPETGVSISVLSELLAECVNEGWSDERRARFSAFRKHVETSDADRENVFAAMNTSFMQDAVLIHVSEEARILQPIVVAYVGVIAGTEALTMISPRVYVHLEKGAKASLLEVYEGVANARYFSNAVSDLRLEAEARLSYCKVQLESHEAFHIGTTRICQAATSFCEAFQFSFGAKLSRQDLHISLHGEEAEVAFDGLYMVGGKQHVDNHTSVEHVVPRTLSSQVYKGIVDGEAKAVFNGYVAILRDAQKSNSSQLNNNLMMSAKAEVDTKPELEIDADDVKAAHGATIGRIDPDHVFYLQTRAIPKLEAVRLLARGFAQDVVFRIRDANLRSRIHELVDARFDQLKIDTKLVDEGN
jgi:Fe-S cluster assembly protein SufD